MLWHKLIGFAILSLLLSQYDFVQSDASVSSCSNNFSEVAGKCLLASNIYLTWFEADRHCRSLGAGLVSVPNETQLQQISQWMNSTLPYIWNVWTSGNSLGQKGSYFWQSTGEQARNLSWSRGQPTPSEGDCLTLYPNNVTNFLFADYRLSIKNCTYWAPHVCEKQPQKYLNMTTRICLKPGSYETAQVWVFH